MVNRRDRLRRGLPCIGPARSLGRHTDGGWWSFRYSPASTERVPSRHREYASMRTSRANDSFGIAAGEALPDVSRCLAFMSPLEVARFAFSTLTCSGLESTAQTDDKSPASESPGAKTALSCLGNVRRSPRTPEVVPQAKGVTPFGAFQTSLRSRARSKLPHLVHRGARLCSGPSRAPRAAAVASELRCTHGLGAHPRLARGMFRRLQQSTISVFKDEHPRHASRFDIDRAVRSSERRRKPPFTTRLPLRCVDWIQPGIGRMNRDRRSL
jgi:hypothetical protein